MMGEMCKNRLMMVAVFALSISGLAAEGPLIEEQLEPADGWSPVGVAFLPATYLQWPGHGSDIDGLQLSLLGNHAHELAGVGLATFGCWADGNMDGLVVAGLCTWSNGSTFGLHMASIVNYAEGSVNGIQMASFNSAYGISGLQLGVVNCASESSGVQCGFWNLTERGCGLQLGLVNMAMDYSGVQIGLGNIIGSSPLTACIFVNAWF